MPEKIINWEIRFYLSIFFGYVMSLPLQKPKNNNKFLKASFFFSSCQQKPYNFPVTEK